MNISDGTEILTHERGLNLPDVLRSSEPSVISLVKTNYPNLMKFAALSVKNYLIYCFPAQANIATQFASDLIEQRPDWKAADFILCFKFIRTRQDLPELKVFGNTITPQKLNEMIAVYEEHRSIEREKIHAERKGKSLQEGKHLNELGEDVAKRLMEKKDKPIEYQGDIPDENHPMWYKTA